MGYSFVAYCVCLSLLAVVGDLASNALVPITEVTLDPVCTRMGDCDPGSTHGAGNSISVYNQPPRSTQPGHLSVRRRTEYQSKDDDALRLGSKCRYGS